MQHTCISVLFYAWSLKDQALTIYFRLNLCQRVPLWSGVYAKLPEIAISDSKKFKPLRCRKWVVLFHIGMVVLKLPILKMRFWKIFIGVFTGFFSPWYLSICVWYPPPLASHPYCSPICVSPHSAKVIKRLYLHSEANLCLREYVATHIMTLSGLKHNTAKR